MQAHQTVLNVMEGIEPQADGVIERFGQGASEISICQLEKEQQEHTKHHAIALPCNKFNTLFFLKVIVPYFGCHSKNKRKGIWWNGIGTYGVLSG